MEYATFNNAVKMPMLGYGVYQVSPEECERCVTNAIKVGYRAIDTAQAYENEAGVGSAVKKSEMPRRDFFLTTKIWITNAGFDKATASIDKSLKRLQTDYVDLLLIHQPFGDYYGTYRAMKKAYKAGKARAIGVSNFYSDRFIDLETFCEVKPAVNQVENHVFQQQKEAHEVMKEFGTQIMAWAPFAEGRNDFFSNPVLSGIGMKYGKSVGQVALRFLIQNGEAVIPKSTHIERMKENFDVFDFRLEQEDMENISALDTGKSLFFSHNDAKTVKGFMSLVQ